MPKRATVRFQALQTCLVNLPLSIYGQLVARQVTPQSLVVCLSYTSGSSGSGSSSSSKTKEQQQQQQQQRVYVGWSGMPARLLGGIAGVGKGEEAVEIDPVCARDLGIPEGAEVAIDLLRNLPAAHTVNVEPVNADDWEIVELHAEYVEQNLLSQIRAASPGQTICVWVGKAKTLIRFRVVDIQPADDVAVRLNIDTEVVIAPKTRNTASSIAKEKHVLSQPSPQPKGFTSASPAAQRARRRLLRILPDRAKIPALQTLQSTSEESVAWVTPDHFNLLAQAFPSTRVSLSTKACPGVDAPALPAEDSQSNGKGKGREHRQDTEDSPSEGSTLRTLQAVNVHLVGDAAVPSGCIWLSSKARKTLDPTAYTLVKLNEPVGKDALPLAAEQSEAVLQDEPPEDGLCPAGMEKHLEKSLAHIRHTLASARGLSLATAASGSTAGLIITGASGSGKTDLVRALASASQTDPKILSYVQHINCTPLANHRVSQLQAKFHEVFKIAAWHAPSIVVFDDLDRLMPAEMEHVDSFRSQHIASLFYDIASMATKDRAIVVVATCKGQETLHASLSQSHFFGTKVGLSAPDKDMRKQIFRSILEKKLAGSKEMSLTSNLDYTSVATQTDGYLPVDLRDLVDRCIQQCAMRAAKDGLADMVLTIADVNAAQADFTPLSLRDVKLQKSEVQWSDIGGLQDTRRVLRETLEWPTKYGAIFASSPLRLRSGLLLYGFPGCGKTLLASAVAKECGLNFISVKGPEILNKYIGASEKSVRDLFDRAQAARPCVLFFDEFDSIAPKRGHDSTGVTDRVVNQMLTQMDGAEGLEGVYVLAATSRPDLIDPALLRPGRLDKSLLCDMPSAQDRFEIMQACARKIAMSPDIDLNDYVTDTEGYSGADLQAVIYNAHLECIHSSISADKTVAESAKTARAEGAEDLEYITYKGRPMANGHVDAQSRAEKAKMSKRLEQIMQSLAPAPMSGAASSVKRAHAAVRPEHIESALKSTRPSVPRDEIRRLQRIYDDFVSARAKGGLPSGQASQEIGGRSSLM